MLNIRFAGPTVFFRGQYVFRTLNGTMAVIVPLVTSAIAAAVAVYGWGTRDDSLTKFVSAIFALGALISGGLGLWTLWSWLRDRRIDVEINENGIICGKRFWAWDQVRSLVGIRYSNGVCLEFTPRRIAWGGGSLPTTPLLTDQEYIELAQDLAAYLSVRFPEVVVATVPEPATAD